MTLLSRVLGLTRDIVIARFYSAGIEADAFFGRLFLDGLDYLRVAVACSTDSDAGSELEGLFAEISECSENRLWKFEPTQ